MDRGQEKFDEGRMRTRRHVLAIWAVLLGTLLASCNRDGEQEEEFNCYLKGTRLLTPKGLQRIEELGIGDPVIVANGEIMPIKWIGRCYYRRGAKELWPQKLRPVRIARGALEDEIPIADLLVSQNHRLFIDGLLIRAADLINGTSIAIAQCENIDEIEYMHILTARHELICAEGAMSETLLFSRRFVRSFDNFDEFERLYGRGADMSATSCAPVYRDFGRRERLYSHLRSALSPWIDRRTKFEIVRDRLASRLGCDLTHEMPS